MLLLMRIVRNMRVMYIMSLSMKSSLDSINGMSLLPPIISRIPNRLFTIVLSLEIQRILHILILFTTGVDRKPK